MNFGSRATEDGGSSRSGGKVVKRRRIGVKKSTPYDRPSSSMETNPNNNWIKNGVLFPAKFVASGATKLFSSIWNPVSWASRSVSTSDTDSDSEGGIEDNNGGKNVSDSGSQLNQHNTGSLSGKSEILYLVEQLLMLESYSREECDRLIEIINSRENLYTHNKAIMEARKLITENMVGSSSKSDLDNNIQASKSPVTPNRDHLSGGSWNLQNEVQQLHSKAVDTMKPSEPISIEAPKPDDKIMNLSLKDTRTTQDTAPNEALSSLPTIEEYNQMAEENEGEDEFTDVPDVNASQGSSTTNLRRSTRKLDSPTANRAVARSRRYTKRGRGRGK
uniref:protein KAKU4-like isoform X2 n=1 Tax=Erigeron canadensis TaxID=72917 RepID=UPI001CB90E76|nr:protein KAKU4-like isoform X2 [Erigeron canadensis]